MNEEVFAGKVRNVTDDDRDKLPHFSYSRLELFKNCPYQYYLKYVENKQTSDTSIALEVGSLCHYILEQKGKMLSQKEKVDYKKLKEILEEGVHEINEKTREELAGIKQLKRKYFDVWNEKDNASGMTYEDKMKVFNKVLHIEMENKDGWVPFLFEHKFEFVWRDRAIIEGFIDRVDVKVEDKNTKEKNKKDKIKEENNNKDNNTLLVSFRTIDYKTSKKTYEGSKLATSLQFGIYALAILNEFDQLPCENVYRFILLDEKQRALTKGWENRLVKALDGVLDQIDECDKKGVYTPSPSPLCHWCNYCVTNPNAKRYKYECPYYCKWMPNNKTYAVNKEFNVNNIKRVNNIKGNNNNNNNNSNNNTNNKRILIF